MKRVAIVGCGGSGKSSLAQRLGECLGIEVFYLDTLFWRPGWVRVPASEQERTMAQILKREKWIIDGDHPPSQPLRFSMADTIVFLDMPQSTCLCRTLKRTLRERGRSRLGVAEGCPERLNWTLLKWILLYRRANRPSLLENIRQHSTGRQIVVLHSPREVDEFVDALAGLGLVIQQR